MSPDRWSHLLAYLRRIAWYLWRAYLPSVDPDDLVQEMALYILERGRRDRAYLAHPDGYLTKSAAWHARSVCRALHDGRMQPLPAGWPVASPAFDADRRVAVAQALRGLSEKDRQVARLISAGYKGRALSARTGLSLASLTRYRARIRRALDGLMEGAP